MNSQSRVVPRLVSVVTFTVMCVTNQSAGLKGLVHIKPGDAVLARPIDKGGNTTDDSLQILAGVMLVISR
jgi:hypothetical protein